MLAQSRSAGMEAQPLVRGVVDESKLVTLAGNSASTVLARYDGGRVEDSFAADRLLLVLKRSRAQEQALGQFLSDAHTPGAEGYHQWLSPGEFGKRFGAADSDIAAATGWLQSHGLRVNGVHAGRIAIEFSGNAAHVSEAFHTEIHRYVVRGTTRYANASDPQIPATLAGLIGGISPMKSVHARPLVEVAGKTSYDQKTHQAKGEWTYPDGNDLVTFELAPADFAMQYNLVPVYAAGTNGTGESIGILSASNVDLSLVAAYQALFGLPANLPTVVIDGNDPGQTDAATEAYLDVEEAGAIAPGAKVVLYTSAGTVLTDPLLTSGLRAVEDNQVAVISVSYGACEAELGATGNAAWAQLWQEAAAQGISVFVATGDNGAAGCDDPDTEEFAESGLAVNGLASTPYNVAVGGSDFYYSDYAVGGSALTAQVGTYWNTNATNAPAASLLQAVPEQVWNDAYGLNAVDSGVYNAEAATILAGGGGASGAALYPASGAVAGYPKPLWQAGTGVPADKLRDVPDVSLFAANGANYVYYPICANAGDCVNTTSAGAVYLTSVGGTSAAAPAMAAIQALVDQATKSRQGQADYLYYLLASHFATATVKPFNDISVGGNEVPCFQGTTSCALWSSGQSKGSYGLSGYLTNAGYDRASGLGSVNVATLIADWAAIALKPSTTTLSITPTTFAHGTTVSVTSTVAPKTGSGTATGGVGLTSNDAQVDSNGLGIFDLSGGTVTAVVNNLPGGTYQLVANYGGDGSFGASASAPVTITVTQEKDTLNTSGWVVNPIDDFVYPLVAGMSIPYGAEVYLEAQPVGVNEAGSTLEQNAPATGSVSFTDKVTVGTTTSSKSGVAVLNSVGLAEWVPAGPAVGSHSVSAAYAGDASYAVSSSAVAASFTVFKGTTTMYVYPLETSVAAGGSVTVDVEMYSQYLPLNGTLPTGSVSVTLGGKTLTAAWSSWGATGNMVQDAVVTFTNVSAGILPLSASYAGDANWLGSSSLYGSVNSMASKPTPAVTLTAAAASYTPNQIVNLTGTVTGTSGGAAPSGILSLMWEDGGASYSGALQKLTANSSGWTLSLPANQLANGTNLFVATFAGDANYSAQSSAALAIVVNGSDFSLITTTPEVVVPYGGSAAGTIGVLPLNGYSGTVTISCSAPSGIICTPAATAPALGTAGVTETITFKVSSTVAAGTFPAVITVSGVGRVHTAQILVENTPPAATPVFSPAPGTYSTAQTVTISDTAPGAVIYYTADGTTPTTSSAVYSAGIKAAATETLKAIATAPGYSTSAAAVGTFTVNASAAAAMPTFSPATGSYVGAQTVTISDATSGATIYYTTNGTTPTSASTKYSAAISIAASETLQAVAIVNGGTTSLVASAAYTIAAAAPSFSPAGGSYAEPQTVTISDATSGAVIYYTTNGTTPTAASTVYSGPVSVTASETVSAIAVVAGKAASASASASYTISGSLTTPAPVFSLPSGSYIQALSVAISDTAAGATIYYTTNGTAPTTASKVYTGPITVSTAQTIEAVATAPGLRLSPVASASYSLAAAAPVINPVGGAYSGPVTVTISTTTPGATIYYTTAGNLPTTSSTKYTGPFTVGSTFTIVRAMAGGTNFTSSGTVSNTYTFPAATPVFSLATGSYNGTQSVTISDSTPAATTIYYTTNGTAPTTSSTKYAGAISVSATETLKAVAIATNYGLSTAATATYTIAPTANAPPVQLPIGGKTWGKTGGRLPRWLMSD